MVPSFTFLNRSPVTLPVPPPPLGCNHTLDKSVGLQATRTQQAGLTRYYIRRLFRPEGFIKEVK